MNFDLWTFLLDNLEAAGVIGAYVSMSIIGVELISFATRENFKASNKVRSKWTQSIIGAMLGVIPGCGGTIVASSMFKKKKLSFGGLVAAFITTLGEGSFVLLGASDEASVSSNLKAFAIVNAVGFIVGIIVGLLLDLFNISFSKKNNQPVNSNENNLKSVSPIVQFFIEKLGYYSILIIALLLAPGSIMALWGGGIEFMESVSVILAMTLTLISIIYYFSYKYLYDGSCCDHESSEIKTTLLHAISDIALVVTYVFIGLFIANFLIDVVVGPETFDEWMTASAFLVILIAAAIGASPGCGGMIAVAVAYTVIPSFPIAALIAAGIATSGDGIFPLLAENKKAGLAVTLLGFIVAVIVGYLTFLLGF